MNAIDTTHPITTTSMDQQDIKNEILTRIRMGKPALRPLPDVPMYAYTGNPVEGFVNRLLSFDGRAIKFRTRQDAVDWLRTVPEMNLERIAVYSTADGVDGNITEEDIADLHNAHRIETCVTESSLGVGETGSVWVTDETLRHAACALFAQHLFIFLDRSSIVGGLHEAYATIDLARHQYGSFFSGPSATADIEAVHITGAQGPLSLTVLLYGCDDAPATPELLVNPDADTSVWQ